MAKDWRAVKAQIETAIDAFWTEEPEEIRRVRWGVIRSGAGTGGQYFTGLVHLEGYAILLGQHLLYGLLKASQSPNVDLDALRMLSREFLVKTFNSFLFMADLGLESMNELGSAYIDALDSLTTKEEYRELTGAMLTYATRTQRWIHFIFPWNLGFAFPQRRPEEIAALAARLSHQAGPA